MRRLTLFFLLSLTAFLPGCVARTALDIVTAPVKIVSKAADMATTSQSEADEKRGRQLRKREQELGKLYRKREKLADKCDDGDRSSCRDLADIEDEIREIGEPDR